MACQTDYPSYGYWVLKGATTTPEYWNMDFSQNHCMMNHIEEWFFSQLGGISNVGYAYDSISIRPYIPDDLTSMSTTVGSPAGNIVCEYTRGDDGSLSYHITARIELPLDAASELLEADAVVSNATAGIRHTERTADSIILIAGSGDYRFSTRKTGNVIHTATHHTAKAFYTLDGSRLAAVTQPGIYIVSDGDGASKRYME